MFDNLENNFDPNLDQSVNNKSYWLSQPSTSALLLPKTCFRNQRKQKTWTEIFHLLVLPITSKGLLRPPLFYLLRVISNNYLKIAAVYYLHLGDIYKGGEHFQTDNHLTSYWKLMWSWLLERDLKINNFTL